MAVTYVTMHHDELDRDYLAPKTAVEHMKKQGWRLKPEPEPEPEPEAAPRSFGQADRAAETTKQTRGSRNRTEQSNDPSAAGGEHEQEA